MAKDKGQNLRRAESLLTGEDIAKLNGLTDGLGSRLHSTLNFLIKKGDAQAGYAGPVVFAKHGKVDPRGVSLVAADLNLQRAGNAADAKDNQDLVTLSQVRRMLAERDPDLENLINDTDITFPPQLGSPAPDYFIGYVVANTTLNAGTNALVAVVNDLKVGLFHLPFDFTVAVAAIDITNSLNRPASIGLYNLSGTLMFSTGLIPTGLPTGVKRMVLTAPVPLPAGPYWMAAGGDTLVSVRGLTAQAGQLGIINSGSQRYGSIANGAPLGLLPASFDPTLIVSEASALPFVLFEAPA